MNLFDNDTLQGIGELLKERKETIAVAESVTSGAVQLAFSAIKEASRFFHGGLTAYNIGQKYHHLAVEPIHAMQVNCVSEQVAQQMAINVAKMFSGDWGIAITGYAVPVPESDNKVFAYYAVSFKGNIISSGKFDPAKDDTLDLQIYYTDELCRKLLAAIANLK